MTQPLRHRPDTEWMALGFLPSLVRFMDDTAEYADLTPHIYDLKVRDLRGVLSLFSARFGPAKTANPVGFIPEKVAETSEVAEGLRRSPYAGSVRLPIDARVRPFIAVRVDRPGVLAWRAVPMVGPIQTRQTVDRYAATVTCSDAPPETLFRVDQNGDSDGICRQGHAESFAAWMGSHIGMDGAAIEHKVPGRRSTRTARGEHNAWCDTCGVTHRCFLPMDAAKADRMHWSCPVHGDAAVRGCVIPAALDDGTQERTAEQTADRKAYGGVLVLAWIYATIHGIDAVTLRSANRDSGVADSTVTLRSVLADKASAKSRLVAASKGTTITQGKRGQFGFRSKGKRGIAIRPEPAESVMASGRYVTRTRVTPLDGGRVLVYRRAALSSLAYGSAGWTYANRTGGRLVNMTAHRQAYLLRVLTAKGTEMKRTPSTKTPDAVASLASLVARDAAVPAVIRSQVTRHAPARSTAAKRAAATRTARGTQKRTGRQVRDNAANRSAALAKLGLA